MIKTIELHEGAIDKIVEKTGWDRQFLEDVSSIYTSIETQPFADWLKTVNKKRGWQKSAAEILGCSPSHIRSLASGRRSPDAKTGWLTAKNLLIHQAIDKEPFGLPLTAIKDWLSLNASLNTFNMAINSPGGDIFECMDAMRHIEQDGRCNKCEIAFATLGSYVTGLGAKTIAIHSKGFLNLTECWTSAQGMSAQSFRETADLLDKVNKKYIDIVEDKRGVDITDLMAVEPDGAWLNAKSALDAGLVDEILD